jgi:hypothetical protein
MRPVGWRRLFGVSLAVLAEGVRAQAASGPPAGIVMSVTGVTTPRLAAYAEIPSDSGVQISRGASLTFLHYERCKLVTVTGGTLMLTPTDYASDGKTVSETATACPVVQALNAQTAATSPVRLPSKPDIIFTGAAGARVTGMSIAEDGRVSPAELHLDVMNRRVHLPSGAALQPNVRYRLQISAGARSAPPGLSFIVGGEASIVVLRLE